MNKKLDVGVDGIISKFMPWIPWVAVNWVMGARAEPQFGGGKNELIFELVVLGILVWNPGGKIM